MSYTIRGKSLQIRVSKRGTKQYYSKTVRIPEGLTKRELKRFAESEERKFENECKGGSRNSNITFSRFVEEDYLVNNEQKDDYKSMLARTLPYLGHLRMNEITRAVIQNFVNRILKDANTRSGKPISVKTLRNNISFISAVFSYAISIGMNIENPCRDISYPKSQKKEASYYSEEELISLLKALDEHPPAAKYKLFVYIAVTTGMRKGEILGLQWRNIDLNTGVINIVQSAKYSKDKGMHIGSTKTATSVRHVKVPSEVVALLKDFKSEQDEYISNMGNRWVGNDFLFTQYDGSLMSIQTPYEWLSEFCDEHDLPFKAIHSMRHTFASRMIFQKMDIVQVSRTLGHAQVSTTANIYLHLLNDASEDACNVAQDLLQKKAKK